MARPSPRWRRVALGVALAVLAAGFAVVVAPSLRWISQDEVARERLHLSPTTDPARLSTGRVRTGRFSTVGVHLPAGAPDGPVRVRWAAASGWSDWHELDVDDDHGPDLGSAEARRAGGGVDTEPLWIGSATSYQVEVPAGTRRAEALLVRPSGRRIRLGVPRAGAGTLNQPGIHSRAEWGARPPSNAIDAASELKLAIVHHSDTGNDYTPAQVPGILRAIQAYHVDGRGWSDLAYNIVVDKYGGIWEGRDGSVDRLSIGAHAQGFNTNTLGVMLIGDYTVAQPSAVAMSAVADVIAWKFANHGVDPASSVAFTSAGSPSIPAGETRSFPRVIGHRDVGQTSCPGPFVASRLGELRVMVAARYPAASSPSGLVDIVGGSGALLVRGWAIDPNTADPISVHAYLDGVGHDLGPADDDRPDLAATFPRTGARHGLSHVFEGLSPGPHRICVFAINAGPGENRLLRCDDAVVPSGPPTGLLDRVDLGPDGRLTVSGWSIDPDTSASLETHVYVDGAGVNLGRTSGDRPDLLASFPLSGAWHGFSYSARVAAAAHEVCVFAINEGPGATTLLGCRRVTPPTGQPVGSLDVAVGGPDGTVAVSGWAIDPDVSASIGVHLYVDGVAADLGPTAVDRSDIAAAFPGYGARHGFSGTRSGLAPGVHQVCVFGIDASGDGNRLLACRSATVPGGAPFGSLDVASPNGRSVVVAGWAIDPDTRAPVPVHVYVDGAGTNTGPADDGRVDIGATFPAYGSSHGFRWTSPALAGGSHEVCVFAIDTGGGANSLLGCRSVRTG